MKQRLAKEVAPTKLESEQELANSVRKRSILNKKHRTVKPLDGVA